MTTKTAVPHVPQPYKILPDGGLSLEFHRGQWRAWDSDKRFVVVLAGTQGGKALALDTPIPTPDGWRQMGDLRAGDCIFDENGSPCRVMATTPTMYGRDCYEVRFDDGSVIVADAEHQWLTQTYAQRKNEARRVIDPNPSWSQRPQCQPSEDSTIRTTSEILETLLDRRGACNHSIPLPKPTSYPERDLPIPPYTLGVWLGDGYSDSTVVLAADYEVIEGIVSEGVSVSKVKYNTNSGKAQAYRLGVVSRNEMGHVKNSEKDSLRSLGILGNKHIPEIYLVSSIDQRLALLQGLMDTDGYAKENGRAEFTTTNKDMAKGFVQLARSLGIKVREKEERATHYGKDCGPKWRMTFSTFVPVFRIERKLARQRNVMGRSDIFKRYISDIRPIKSVPVRCISVDSENALYLAGNDYIVTHNTSWGGWWLHREIQRRGPGDYLIVTPTYPLLNLKALPEFLRIFQTILKLGNHGKADKVFTFDAIGERRTWGSEQEIETRVIFGHAQDPEGLESATAKAAWLDEAGQNKFKLASFEAIMRRLSLAQGRVLITTTPYNLGWLKQQFWDKQSERDDIEVIRFDSTENPAFPQEEMERARRDLPRWKFDMFYRAIFTRPAGMIYDCFDEAKHKIRPFPIPDDWKRYMGQDYGGVNTAAVYLAQEPDTNRLYLYREYWHGGRTAKDHKRHMLDGEPTRPHVAGGAKSEQQWRDEFAAAGMPVKEPPISDVEVGIDRVYGAIQNDELFIFNDCDNILDEIMSYSRELNDMGEPTEKIADKSTFHLLDALRYIISYLRQENKAVASRQAKVRGRAGSGRKVSTRR